MEQLGPDDPATVGPYRLVAQLGSGGMGRVYLGYSPGGRQVAIKVIRPEYVQEPAFRRRFAREVVASRAVSGFFTAGVVDADPEGPRPWLATAYIPGPSLARAVHRAGPLPERSVRALGAALVEALVAIHAAQLIHRDLKPANVLLAQDGPRVIDFGISRLSEHTGLTLTGTTIGSPGYMAPEQIQGLAVTPGCDVFSLGSVLAFSATGTGPFGEASVPALLYRVVNEDPDLTAVPAGLRDVIAGCLAKRPEERPPLPELMAALSGGRAPGELLAPGWLPEPWQAVDAAPAPPDPRVSTPDPRTPLFAPRTPAPDPYASDPYAPDPRTPEPYAYGSGTLRTAPTAATERQSQLQGPTPPPPATPPPDGAAARPSRRRVLLGAAGVLAAGGAAATAWTLLGGDDRPPAGTSRWTFTTTGTVLSYPRVAGGLVYAASNDGTLYAIGTDDGQQRWKYTSGAAVGSAPAVLGGAAYLGSDDKVLYSLDAVSGAVRWKFTTGGIVHTPVVGGGLVYVGSADKKLYAVDAATGKRRWAYPTGNDTHSPTLSGQTVYVGCSDTNLYALDASSGEKRWAYTTRGAVSGIPAVSGGLVFFGSTDNALYAVDAGTGRLVWRFAGASVGSHPAPSGDTVYVGGGKDLHALEASTGKPRWKFTTRGDVHAPVVSGSTVYVGSSDNTLYALDAASGKRRWSYAASAPLHTPGVGRDCVFIGSDDGTLIALYA
ncbi:PQQ-binding-like beta-propeller repeat protein [Streptomyces sp. NPDC001941]|uniref:outer membrane protein assembly factor BamB family protein n=1 Tax=Streptomyces sp. NPDC001941 TaxID=3154659 RepID=UPI003331A41E